MKIVIDLKKKYSWFSVLMSSFLELFKIVSGVYEWSIFWEFSIPILRDYLMGRKNI